MSKKEPFGREDEGEARVCLGDNLKNEDSGDEVENASSGKFVIIDCAKDKYLGAHST